MSFTFLGVLGYVAILYKRCCNLISPISLSDYKYKKNKLFFKKLQFLLKLTQGLATESFS